MIKQQIQGYILETYCDTDDEQIQGDTPLLELNILDSMSIYDLIAFIDRALGINIPFTCINADNFRTVESITAMIERLQEEN